MVLIPDDTADERRIKAQHRVPARRHDVAFAFVSGAEQNDRAGLEKTADFIDGKVLLFDHSSRLYRMRFHDTIVQLDTEARAIGDRDRPFDEQLRRLHNFMSPVDLTPLKFEEPEVLDHGRSEEHTSE